MSALLDRCRYCTAHEGIYGSDDVGHDEVGEVFKLVLGVLDDASDSDMVGSPVRTCPD
jgi:hypothetical protein